MTYIPRNVLATAVETDPGGRSRASTLTTLFDGKVLDSDDTSIWQNTGTGTFNFVNNQMQMSVTAGQYCIRRGRYRCPYSSGKPQLIEVTADTFGIQANVTKRMGYFSSSTAAPYSANLDGVWLENDGTTIYLKAARNGSETMSIEWTEWDNFSAIAGYNWNNFTVCLFDFLWLGGTELRLFLKTPEGFILVHTEPWASTAPNTFISSPTQEVRYEIRSTTGTGSLNAICSQVATEGDINQTGKSRVIYSPGAVTTNAVGTIYAIKSFRIRSGFRNVVNQVVAGSVTNTSTADFGIVMVIVNPTITGTLNYTADGSIESGNPATPESPPIITAGTGRIIGASPAGQVGELVGLNNNFLSYAGTAIDGTADQLVLAYMPTSINQSVFGTMTIKEL